MSKPGLLTGALVGLLLTAPLVVISGLGHQLLGLPFVPFDLFPFIRDNTPGGVMTFVIDTMVDTIISTNAGRVDVVAKQAEQAMAVAMLLGVGVVAGALFFAVHRSLQADSGNMPGLVLGLIVGILMALISLQYGLSSTTNLPALDFLWILALFLIWGLLMGWAYRRLALPDRMTTARPTAA